MISQIKGSSKREKMKVKDGKKVQKRFAALFLNESDRDIKTSIFIHEHESQC